MKLKPYPLFPWLRSAMARQEAAISRPWAGLGYRCSGLPHAASTQLISGKGTRLYGSRWMAPQVERVVYASTTEGTALSETRSHFERYGLDGLKPEPRVIVTLELRVTRLLDLLRADFSEKGITLPVLLTEDWGKLNEGGKESLCQAVGRAALDLGYEAMLTPSARLARGRNLAIILENLAAESYFAIAHKSVLKKWLG